jgi:hypothetical protein
MNIHELAQRLTEEGCNPNYYAIGSRGSASDAYCLTHNGQEWQVYYTERGQDQSPEYSSKSEEEACEYFFGFIMKMRHDHLVGFFRSEASANELRARLENQKLHPFQDKIPYGGWDDPRYRVFVTGREIFSAKDILGSVPVKDIG